MTVPVTQDAFHPPRVLLRLNCVFGILKVTDIKNLDWFRFQIRMQRQNRRGDLVPNAQLKKQISSPAQLSSALSKLLVLLGQGFKNAFTSEHSMETVPLHRFARDKGYSTKEVSRVSKEKEFPGFLENQRPSGRGQNNSGSGPAPRRRSGRPGYFRWWLADLMVACSDYAVVLIRRKAAQWAARRGSLPREHHPRSHRAPPLPPG
ncbi:Protein S100-A10 [Galemys pyrenaicus]|uniref:Protein S100-A10 n=1 Tax=Galemys pyrenaicus TaxID=202257 RepID=A0A8J5ZTR3_GALPY|nr:Protein S100-A10 [Galemys pyrenaicus]